MFIQQQMCKRNLLYLFATAVIILTACKSGDDNRLTAAEEHFEAIGTVVYNSSDQITLSILRGSTEDTLFAYLGELSEGYYLKFYDEEENIIDPPDDEHSLMSYEVDDNSIVEIVQDPGKEGEFEFKLRGISAGKTEIEFFIQHEGHNDYRSGKIPVIVK